MEITDVRAPQLSGEKEAWLWWAAGMGAEEWRQHSESSCRCICICSHSHPLKVQTVAYYHYDPKPCYFHLVQYSSNHFKYEWICAVSKGDCTY